MNIKSDPLNAQEEAVDVFPCESWRGNASDNAEVEFIHKRACLVKLKVIVLNCNSDEGGGGGGNIHGNRSLA